MTRGHCADLSGFTPESILIRSSQGQAPAQSWGRMSGSARHPLAGRPVEGYICPVKQEAPMNAAPWPPGVTPVLEGVPSLLGRLWRGQWASEGRIAGFLLPCFRMCYFS